jgi:hypothetical protein
MTKKELKARREFAIKKCVSVLTENNGIDIFLIGKLSAKLEAMELADLGLIIASQYSPEGNMKWQELLAA